MDGFKPPSATATPGRAPRRSKASDRPREPAAADVRHVGDELLRINRLATLGDLLAEVVHEVRNPLVSVKTFLQLLPDHLDDADFHTNFRGVVIEEVRRMERLLDEVLRHARPVPAEEAGGSAAAGSILESVGRLLEQRAQERGLHLTIDVGADLPEAAIGPDPLRQIVLNLALNALEATPRGGRVRLTATVGRRGEREYVDLTVDDQGPGVPHDQRDRLFDAFFSTRSERPGGLGLTVCDRLTRAANGTIGVEDAPGGGARFRVRLPVAG